MEISRDLSAENISFSKDKNILNDIAQETKDTPGYGSLTEEELMEKVENILLDKIKEGEKQAYFQLGLFYYEQVKLLNLQSVNLEYGNHRQVWLFFSKIYLPFIPDFTDPKVEAASMRFWRYKIFFSVW